LSRAIYREDVGAPECGLADKAREEGAVARRLAAEMLFNLAQICVFRALYVQFEIEALSEALILASWLWVGLTLGAQT